MIPPYWYSPPAAVLWQVTLHSAVVGVVFFLWARHLGLPPGRPRRWMLAVVLLLPWLTALVPGRGGFDFRERLAWLDSLRLLALPLGAGAHVYHLVLAAGLAAVAATLWQEVLPTLRRPHWGSAAEEPTADLVARVRALPGWGACRVRVSADGRLFLATSGWPWRPRLLLSRAAADELSERELDAALAHEHAHTRRGRWVLTHLLFAARAAQCFNPVALWAFREYLVEEEIACDAAAAGRDAAPLVRVLLRAYEETGGNDLAARGTLRRRVDILLGRRERSDDALAPEAVLVAAVVLLVTLPWIV